MSSHKFLASVVAVTLFGAAACGGGSPEPEPATPAAAEPAATTEAAGGDGHAHNALHGGTLVELGDHFGFVELVFDQSAGSLTVYVLDGEAEKAVRITQPTISITFDAPERLTGETLTLTAQANVLTGETVGDTSQFSVVHEALKGQSGFSARIGEVTVKGQTFRDLVVKPAAL